jgi:hypothetical protein
LNGRVDRLRLVDVKVVGGHTLLQSLYLLDFVEGLSDCMLIAHTAFLMPDEPQLSIGAPLLFKGLIKDIHEHHQVNPLNLFQTHPLCSEPVCKPLFLMFSDTKIGMIV